MNKTMPGFCISIPTNNPSTIPVKLLDLSDFFFLGDISAGLKDPQTLSLPAMRRGSSAASFPFRSLSREKAQPVQPSLNRLFHAQKFSLNPRRSSKECPQIKAILHPADDGSNVQFVGFFQILIFCELLVSFQPFGHLMWLFERLVWKTNPKITLQGEIPALKHS